MTGKTLKSIPDWIKGDDAMGKRLSDDSGLAEMKRMEYLMSKAPCVARLKELAAWSAKDD